MHIRVRDYQGRGDFVCIRVRGLCGNKGRGRCVCQDKKTLLVSR